jgi:hypothetical protein
MHAEKGCGQCPRKILNELGLNSQMLRRYSIFMLPRIHGLWATAVNRWVICLLLTTRWPARHGHRCFNPAVRTAKEEGIPLRRLCGAPKAVPTPTLINHTQSSGPRDWSYVILQPTVRTKSALEQPLFDAARPIRAMTTRTVLQ